MQKADGNISNISAKITTYQIFILCLAYTDQTGIRNVTKCGKYQLYSTLHAIQFVVRHHASEMWMRILKHDYGEEWKGIY